MSTPRIGVYPGTFDPVTNGHLDIMVRALHVVDELRVAVAVNAGKGPLFTLNERTALIEAEIKNMGEEKAKRISVIPFEGLLVDFVRAQGASVIVRGLRAVSDFEYEFQMAGMNRRLDKELETVFLMASDQVQFISSRFVKEIARLGGDISHFVSDRVKSEVDKKYA